jgi:RNA polymerase sigma factor (sigma-70 family)
MDFTVVRLICDNTGDECVRIPIVQNVAVSGETTGDIAALARLYGPRVLQAAWRVLGNRAAAEDIQQQLFLRLIESPPKSVQSWSAYLIAAATRMAIDVLRRQHRWRLLAPLWKSDEDPDSPTEHTESSQSERRLRQALARLGSRDASCFVMRHVQGLSASDVAQALGMSENNVSVVVHRARKSLEKYLQEQS